MPFQSAGSHYLQAHNVERVQSPYEARSLYAHSSDSNTQSSTCTKPTSASRL
jgi:hypothetical protein